MKGGDKYVKRTGMGLRNDATVDTRPRGLKGGVMVKGFKAQCNCRLQSGKWDKEKVHFVVKRWAASLIVINK